MTAMDVYGRLPAPLQHAAVSAYGYRWRRRRLGGRFPLYRAEALSRERYDTVRWEQWQTRRLREILRIAWDAPAHHVRLAATGLRYEDVAHVVLGDLPHLPLLAKDDVRVDPVSFCPGGAPGAGVTPWSTRGSTGTPLVTYSSADDYRRGLALRDARYGSFCGVDYSLPRGTFSGREVAPGDGTGPFHRYNLAEHQLYFSPYHLGPATVAEYVKPLRRHRPAWLTGYARTIHLLARLARDQHLEVPPLRAVITAAEPVSELLRADVGEVFGCRVFEEYGLIEDVAVALECEAGSLHVCPDAGRVEILRPDGSTCAVGESGEIVATGFLRESQPLIRYRTGDVAAWSAQPCACGREMPVLEGIEGRLDDTVVGADGRFVTRLSGVPKDLPGVVMMQFVQDRPGQIAARVVADGPLGEAVRAEIARRLVARLGEGTETAVEQVDALETTPRGKVRSVLRTFPLAHG
jgi:phenylacetate-CoA ligase